MINNIFPKIHKEGHKFIAISVILSFVGLSFSKIIGLIFIILTIWIYYFFRDPDRVSINQDKFFVSPADGIVSSIMNVSGPKELGLEEKTFTRISIFMNVFNCHVNRTPVTGIIEEIFYKPGKFVNASLDKASEENERNFYKIKTKGREEQIIVVQIAGLIARRIVCEVQEKQEVGQGERIGMIRFGSRVDIYFNNRKTLVKKGQNVIAGESLIAED
tara:strand:- start:1019 stop:1669 length:651 start_codon:yes stop_codon:yes gene_type:complete